MHRQLYVRICCEMENDYEMIHEHCNQCIKILKCTVIPKPGLSCNIISCPLDCGARFHACKGQEHKILCLNEKVPCINVGYGCPALMPRKNQAKHLNSCPASVIHCPEEWDRWPIHVHDKKFLHDHSCKALASSGHYDVALAMRDQRMLHRWCIAVKQKQNLNFQNFKISPSSCLWIFKKRQSSRENSYPPGLEQSVCNELCRTCNKSRNEAINSLSYSNNNVSPASMGLDALKNEHQDRDNELNLKNQVKEIEEESNNKQNNISFSNNKIYNGTQCCLPQYNLDDVLQLAQFEWIYFDSLSCAGSVHMTYSSEINDMHKPVIGTCNDRQNIACQIVDFKFRNPASTPPWSLSLGLDINMESRSQHQPSNFMYSFLCSQDFRRDQYGWHYKNVHSEIHSGLNGWLLERCPLAQYGCKFARKRFNPLPKSSTIVYSETLESFGVAMSLSEDNSNHLSYLENTQDDFKKGHHLNLLQLPFHVLQKITSYLDNFSLSNLSLTCTSMRDVCSSLIKEHGLVLLLWERIKEDDKYKWKVSNYKKWFFSTHFTPIHNWTFDENNNMSNHLKSCKYFNRVIQNKSFCYVNIAATSSNSISNNHESHLQISENKSTKL